MSVAISPSATVGITAEQSAAAHSLATETRRPVVDVLEQQLALTPGEFVATLARALRYPSLTMDELGDCARDVNGVYVKVAQSVAAYEESAEVNPYSSQFDLFWDKANAAGKDVTKIKCGTGMGGGMMGMGCPGGGMDRLQANPAPRRNTPDCVTSAVRSRSFAWLRSVTPPLVISGA